MLEWNKQRYGQYPRKPGYIYILHSPDKGFKIGKTKDIRTRMQNHKSSLPFPFTHIHTIRTGDLDWAEWALHRKFAACRGDGEWFDLSSEDLTWLQSLSTLTPDTH